MRPQAPQPRPAASCPDRCGILPFRQIPSSAAPDQPRPPQLPLLSSETLSRRHALCFPEQSLSSKSGVVPTTLVSSPSTWPTPPSSGQLPQGPSPATSSTKGSTGSPIPSPGMPSPGLAQRSCSPLSSPSSPAHPGKRLRLGEGSSIPSSAAACRGQRAQPGNAVATGGGGAVWTQAPLCPA